MSFILRQEPFGMLLYDIARDTAYISHEVYSETARLSEIEFFQPLYTGTLPLKISKNIGASSVRFVNNISKSNCISAPYTVFLELTKKCNLQCAHCMADSQYSANDNLSLDKWKSIISQLSEIGVFSVKITGGEPFLRNDIFEILDSLSLANINFIIFTNGLLIDKIIAEKLQKYKRLLMVRVSIDGDKETNDSIRGVGSYEKAFACIKTLKAYNIPIEVNYTITSKNCDLIGTLSEDMLSKDLVFPINIGMVKIAGRANIDEGKTHYCDEKNIDNCINAVKSEIKKHSTIKRFHLLTPLYYYLFGKQFGCPAARLTTTIKHNGDVFACGLFAGNPEHNCGNVLQESFHKIWNGKMMNTYRDLPIPLKCLNCKEFKNRCTGACRGNALNYSGDITGEDINCKFYTLDFVED